MGAQRPLLASRAERFLNYFLTSPVAQRVRKENLTYLTPLKMRRLEKAVSKALKDNVAGDVAEFGIALGGSAIVLARHARHFGRRFHGFDVFGMIPPPACREWLHLGSCLTDATPRAVPGTPLSSFATTLGPSGNGSLEDGFSGRSDHAVEPCSQRIQHVSKNLRICPACPGRHMKGMIGIRKQL